MGQLTKYLSKPVFWLFLITVAGLLLRCLFVVIQWKYSVLSAPFYGNDSYGYDSIAQSLVSGEGYLMNGQPSAFRTPGYPLFLASMYAIFGRDFFVVSIVQCFLGAASCLLVYGIAKSVFDKRTGIFAAAIFAFTPNSIIWTSGYISTETLFTFLSVFSLYLLILLLREGERRAPLTLQTSLIAGATGVLLALSSLTRPVFIYFSVLAIIYLTVFVNWRRVLLVSGMFLLLMTVWTVHNYSVFGKPIYSTTGGGWVLYEYHNPATQASNGGLNPGWAPNTMELSSQVPLFPEAEQLSEIEKDEFYMRKVKEFVLANPGKEIELSVNRFWNIWRPSAENAKLRTSIILWLTYVPTMLFAIPAFFWFGLKNKRIGLLTLFLIYHFFFYLFLVAEMRFRFPLEPILMVFAAAGFWSITSYLSNRFSVDNRFSQS